MEQNPAPLRIVMVFHGRRLGGIERHVLALSAALTAAGHQIAFAGPRTGWLGTAMREAGHPCLHLPMQGMYDPLSAWKLRRFAHDWKADLLHGHGQRGTRYALWAGAERVPVIATAHATNAYARFRHDHPIIAVSEAVRSFLLTMGFAPDRVRTIHLGVRDLGPAKAAAQGPIDEARPLVLGMLARVEPVKGHDLALHAMHLLRDRLATRLVVAGPDGTDWARNMKALALDLGLWDRVEFMGETSNIQGVFDRTDVMLAPSRREALSLSLIETAAAGRPSIGARIGGIPEVIADGQSGLLVPAEDPAALAEAILLMGTHDALREQMGSAARAIFERQFTQAVMVRATEAAYIDTIEQKRRGRG